MPTGGPTPTPTPSPGRRPQRFWVTIGIAIGACHRRRPSWGICSTADLGRISGAVCHVGQRDLLDPARAGNGRSYSPHAFARPRSIGGHIKP